VVYSVNILPVDKSNLFFVINTIYVVIVGMRFLFCGICYHKLVIHLWKIIFYISENPSIGFNKNSRDRKASKAPLIQMLQKIQA
jgi:hypothetical protein